MHVSKSTAKKLKAAGYPQPENTGRGAWYADDIGETISTVFIGDVINWSKMPGAVYSPNALELMQTINECCLLGHINDKWEVLLRVDNGWNLCFCHDNPAEALAEAYLHIHQPIEA